MRVSLHTILRRAFLVCALPVAFCSGVYSQNYRVTGTVSDKDSGEPLAGANVTTNDPGLWALTDSHGQYRLDLPQGKYTLATSYIGHEADSAEVTVNRDMTVDFALVSNNVIETVVISTRRADINVSGTNIGVDRLTVGEIKRMPTLLGEVDIIKAVQLLPGVQATSEGSSGFSVRGGSPDQNLILLDNTAVYNASHLMGFFSVFNNDVVKELELYKGDLPLRHGGRLSSLLDVQTRDKIPERFGLTGGIGLISSRLMLEGPLGGKTSWLAAGRRSYADMFLFLAPDESMRDATIYFYDLNLKVSHRFSRKDILELNGYYGNDRFGAEVGRFRYGNAAASLTWKHHFDNDFRALFSLNFSNYDYGLSADMETMKADWDSGIMNAVLRADFEQRIGDLWNLTYGLTGAVYRFDPGSVRMDARDDYDMPGSNALEYGIYISNEQELGERLTLKYGVRLSIFQNMGAAKVYRFDENYHLTDSTSYRRGEIYHTTAAPEPRIGFAFRLSETSSLKGNYARNTQFIQLANNSASGSPLDVWFPTGPNIEPQHSQMVSLGYFRNFNDNMFETSMEFYYKDMRGVIDFREHADLLLNGKLDGEVRTGTGKAYGMELMVRKNMGTVNGFVNYTLSRSERTIPGVNDGKTYLAPYDKTHMLNLVLNFEISRKLTASLIWTYATGNPTTYPVGRFQIGNEIFPIFSARNEYRRPDYHRLDLSLTYIPNPDSRKRFRGEWNLSVYNAYNKKNPWIINFRTDPETNIPYGEMTYLFGIVPSITYNFRF